MREATNNMLPRSGHDLVQLVKALPLQLLAPQGIDRAISTAGGVPFVELDDRYMLRKRPGVFLAGEMIDWDAPTGGYLLQATLSTAVAAARGALSWWEEQVKTGL
jgi:predicted flavoprotein YhiN